MSEGKQQTKKFQKGERVIPAAGDKALKYYPAEDEAAPKKVSQILRTRGSMAMEELGPETWCTNNIVQTRKAIHPYKPRPSLTPGRILILLAGRFRGKRVVLLKVLDQGVLLVTGPFKVNGVPLRRVNARYVIATSTSVDINGIDKATVDKVGGEGYFARDKKADKKGSEEAFFNQGEKAQKKQVSSDRAEDQKKVDKALLAAIKKVPDMSQYLSSSFSLRKGDRPHEMVF